MAAVQAQAGPSRPRKVDTPVKTAANDDAEGGRAATTASSTPARPGETEEGDEDEELMDLKTIQSIAKYVRTSQFTVAPVCRCAEADYGSKVQYAEGGTRTKIVIPKRGEKDFEPLQETVNLQEMMLQKSREALFNALVGVRGGNRSAFLFRLPQPVKRHKADIG